MREALGTADWSAYQAIILVRKIADGLAEALLPQVRRLAPQAAVILVTGYPDLDSTIAALRQGAADYILKPVNVDALRAFPSRKSCRRDRMFARALGYDTTYGFGGG